jgi:hypothetical protein
MPALSLVEGHEPAWKVRHMPSNETAPRERSTRRYYAQHVRLSAEKKPQEELQGVLDAGDRQEWHLVGAAGPLGRRRAPVLRHPEAELRQKLSVARPIPIPPLWEEGLDRRGVYVWETASPSNLEAVVP